MTTNGVSGLDPVTVKILWDRLSSIASEATITLYRTAFSTVVRESNDFACTIMDAGGGGTLAQSDVGLPSFVATQAITLRAVLEKFPVETLKPGDVLITNDPWIGTFQVMDFAILAPIFHREKVVAFAGSVSHTPDIGGLKRWTLALDIFEEGLFVPPMYFHREGVPNADLLEIIEANSRTPKYTLGDLDAQFASLKIMERRLQELMEEQNLNDLDELVMEIYGRSELAMRAVIDEIPDGRYTSSLLIDNNFPDPLTMEVEPDRQPLEMRTAVTIDGPDITVDYSGSSPQVRGGINSGWTFTQAYTGYGVRFMMVPYLPHNAGFLRPIEVISETGTIMAAAFPAPNMARHAIGHQVVDGVYAALAEIIPERTMAQGGSAPVWVFACVGEDRRGNTYHRILVMNGGLGGMPQKDGEVASFPGNFPNTPCEVIDDTMQVIVESKEAIPDSAGPGKFRGAFGQRLTYRFLDPVVYTIMLARLQHPPKGLLGGWPARAGRILLNGKDIGPGSGPIEAGDVLVFETPGGGGLYSPLERTVDAVVADVEEELVSIEVARDAYGVVIDPQTLTADVGATDELRASLSQNGHHPPPPAA